MEIKNIIFDLGGVIYDIRYENIADKFREYGLEDFERYYTQAAQSNAIDLFEEGRMSVPEFRSYIRSVSDIPLTDEQIDTAWNAILIGIPKSRWDLLGKLRVKYNTFLFSNTNQLNYDCFMSETEEKYGFNLFEVSFKKAYFSQLMGTRKPKLDGFHTIVAENGLNPDETLFIDDNPLNVEAARKAGLHGYHLSKTKRMEDMFTTRLTLAPEVLNSL